MPAGHFVKKSKSKTEIPSSSLADIVFVLLLFFMVTTTVRNTELKVHITYPQAKNIEKISQKRLLSYIYVGPRIGGNQNQNQEGQGQGQGNVAIEIDNSIVSMGDISNIMRRKYNAQPRLIVSIRMDKNTRAGVLSDIQQQLQDAGALRVNYSSKPKGQKPAAP
jgi:biopolymer transport protein ExbD